jgi:two-component system, cell cycle response regulator
MRVRASETLKSFDLLYVEDDPAVRDAMTAILSRHFKSIRVAENGQEGIDMFIEQPVPIVVTDIKMPIMDGTEMARYMKEYDPNVHIIITTAYGESNHFIDAIEAGVDGFLTKPVDKSKLFTKLNSAAKSLLALRQQQEMQAKVHMLLNYQKNLLMLCTDGEIEYANHKTLSKLSAISIDHLNELTTMSNHFSVESQEKILNAMPPSSVNWVEGLLALETEDQLVSIEKDGHKDYLQVEIVASEDKRHHIITLNEITELKNELSKQEYLATHDTLTGLYNRSFISSLLEHHIKDVNSNDLCLILCDIDFFKDVNDTHGHLIGDEVLIEFSQRLTHSIRSIDKVGRWGGEEFLIFIHNQDEQNSLLVAEKILSAINSRPFDKVGDLTCSLGVTSMLEGDTCDSLFTRVDQALYEAKESGRNKVVNL